MAQIMTEEYCRQCPFFVEHVGYLEKDDPYWKENPAECACKECPDREHCEQYGPKTLWECMKSELIRRHGVSKGEHAMSHFDRFLQHIKQGGESMEKWQAEVEEILREHYQDDKPSQWMKMTEELIRLTREVEKPSGGMGEFIDRVLNHATEKNGSLVVAYIGFRIGVAYERYQNAHRGVK